MATAIENAEPRAVTVYEAPEGGWEDDGTSGIAPQFPTIKIVQPTSSMKDASRNAGAFFHGDYEEYEHTLDAVGILARDTRAYFKEGEDTPACASPDANAPFPAQRLWKDRGELQPPSCDLCPFSAWNENDGTPPPCRQSTVVLVDREPDADMPNLAQLRIGGKSLKPYRQFVARKLAPKRLPLFTKRLHLYTEEKSEPGKKWFELRIDADDLPRAKALQYNEILRAQRQQFVAGTEQTFDEPEAPARVAPDWHDDGDNLEFED